MVYIYSSHSLMSRYLRKMDSNEDAIFNWDYTASADLGSDTKIWSCRNIAIDALRVICHVFSKVFPVTYSFQGHRDVLDPNPELPARRRLAQCFSCTNWIVLWTFIAIVTAYCGRYIVYPGCKKFHHYCTKRRVTNHLDGFDEEEMELQLARTNNYIDEETGLMVYADKNAIAEQVAAKRTEMEVMMDLLRKQSAEQAQLAALNKPVDEVILGPDGKPLLPDLEFDIYGRIIDPATGLPLENTRQTTPPRTQAVGLNQSSPSVNATDGDNCDTSAIQESDMPAANLRKSKKKKIGTSLKKLSPKKLHALEKKRQENKEFRDAYAAAIRIPTVEERVETTIEAFEQNMLHGTEPLGYEMSLELCKKVKATTDLSQVQLMRHSNYFHKLCADEKLEMDKYRHRKVKITLQRPKSASAAFNALMIEQFAVLEKREEVRNEMGFVKRPSSPPKATSPRQPLKREGKRLEDGASVDKGLVSRGFGTLPTRTNSPLPHGVRALKNGPPKALFEAAAAAEKANASTTPREIFAADGSGRPASPAEIQERGRQQLVRQQATLRQTSTSAGTGIREKSGSPSYADRARSRSPSPPKSSAADGQSFQRPRTAKQFRSSHY